MHIALTAEVPTIDQSLAIDSASRNVIETLNEGLVRLNSENKIVPALAQSWTVSKDSRVFTFRLRLGLLWSDGVAVTAQNFVDAAQRALTPKAVAAASSFLLPIVNAQAYYSGRLKDFAEVGIHAVGSETLKIELRSPLPHFINIAAYPVLMPIRKDLIDKFGERWTDPKNHVGTGPYRLKEKDLHGKIVCEKNSRYWDRAVLAQAIDEVEFQFLRGESAPVLLYQRGDFDIVDGVPQSLIAALQKSEPGFRSERTLFVTGIGFKLTHPALKSSEARRALAQSIDREKLKRLLSDDSQLSKAWIPDELVGGKSRDGIAFDPVGARALWNKIGNRPHKLTYLFPTSPKTLVIAQYLQRQWKENLGLEVELEPQEWKVFLKSRIHDEFPIYKQNWVADYPDAINFLEIFKCDNEQNHPHLCDARYDALLEKSLSARSNAERFTIYEEAERILLRDEVVVLPLTRENMTYLVNPRLKNFAVNGTAQYRVVDLRF